MISKRSTLTEVCFVVSAALETHGINAVLTGGSAATVYAPLAYSSDDADFVVTDDEPLAHIVEALASIGFERDGKSRMFVHPQTNFTLDFPRGPLAIGGDYVHETAMLTNHDLTLRILHPTDCVRDRLAHFYHWGDYTALGAAVGVAAANRTQIDMRLIRSWSKREQNLVKFAEFERRLSEA